jgi:hypothetical protein
MRMSGPAYHDSKQEADAELNEIMAAADTAWLAGDRSAGVRAIGTMFAVLDDRSAGRDRPLLPIQTHRSRRQRH